MSPKLTRRDLFKIAGATGLALTNVGATFAAPATMPLATRAWRVTGQEVPSLAAFDATVKTAMQEFNISCGALAVTYNSRLVLARGYTWSDVANLTVQPTSLFRIASISKPITATAVLRLVQDGKLSLDDKLTDLLALTPMAGQNADPRLNDITLLELLQHRGGWDRTKPGGTGDIPFLDTTIAQTLGKNLPISIDDMITYATGLTLDNDPGGTYVYSNYGYILLGRIIEAVSGMSYNKYVKEKVFTPLGITDTRLGRTLPSLRDPREVPYVTTFSGPTVLDNSGTIVPSTDGGFNLENLLSAGRWVSSVPDLARFLATFDQPDSSPVLNAASMGTMFALSPLGVNSRGFSYGCGWRIYPLAGGARRIEHDGVLPGTLAFVNRLPNGANWVALFNQSYDPTTGDHLQIEGRINDTANVISSWPTNDLFGTYFPTNTTRRFYLLDTKSDDGKAQLFTAESTGNGQVVAHPLGALLSYDLQGLATDPVSGRIYSATGKEASGDANDGVIFMIDGTTGALTRLGATGFSKVTVLAVKPTDGSLWGWVDGKGLISIDTTTGAGTLFYKTSRKVEGMAWSLDGSLLYLARDETLSSFDPVKKKAKTVSSKLPKDTMSLDMLSGGSLIGCAGSKDTATIFTFDPSAKKVIQQWPLVAEQGAKFKEIDGLAVQAPKS